MSRFIIILLLAIISGSNKLAAQIDSAQFLLRNFENGYVYYKDGRTFNVPLNYSLLIKKFLFQDQHDNNNIKEFSEPEMVATIKIGERIFLPTKDGAKEELAPAASLPGVADVPVQRCIKMGRQTGRLRRAFGNIGGRLLFLFPVRKHYP